MITETFTLPFDLFVYFVVTGLVFAMFVHFAVVFVANLKILEHLSRLFKV